MTHNHNFPCTTMADMIVAVDFDGTCVTHDYPKVGQDVGAVPHLRRITNEGGKLILWTIRSDDKLADAVAWFDRWQLPLFGVQSNPQQHKWSSSPKAYAHIYIDDAALGCPLVRGPGGRPHVDWDKVSQWLWTK